MIKYIKPTLVILIIIQLSLASDTFARQKPHKRRDTRNIEDKWFGKDKMKHLSVSILASTLAYFATKETTGSDSGAMTAGITFPVGLGMYKEFDDSSKGGKWSYKDFIWDLAGVSIAVSASSKLSN